MIVRRSFFYACVVVSFIIIFVVSPLADPSQVIPGVKEQLDVVLVIDNSGSMGATDPNRLRFKAASAFVGYLKLNTDAINSRIGVVHFGTSVTTPMEELCPVTEDGYIRGKIVKRRTQGTTNFPSAMRAAYNLLEKSGSFDSARKCAVILFTDGWADTLIMLIELIRGVEKEFERIGKWAEQLRRQNCSIYVVYTSTTPKYEEHWMSIASKGFYYHRESIEQASLIYRSILEALIVEMDLPDKVWDGTLTGRHDESVMVEPYLRKIVFTVQKRKAPVLLEIRDPDGRKIEPGDFYVIHTGSSSEYDEGYSVIKPKSGEWTITLKGEGWVSVWADRYAFEITIDEPGSYIVPGEPIPITAYLVDPMETFKTPIESDSDYPLEFAANIRKEEDQEWKLLDSLKLSPEDTARSIFSGTSKEASEGVYALEVIAKAEGIPWALDTKCRYGIIALMVPIVSEITIQSGEIGKTGFIKAVFENHDVVTPSTPLDVWAEITDANGTPYSENIRLNRIPGTNAYEAPLGHVAPDGEVIPFGDSDPTGWYKVVLHTSYVTSDGLKIDGEKEERFCVIESRENLPLPETLTFLDKDGRKLNPNKLVKGREVLARVAIKNFNKATPESLIVKAQVINPDGVSVQSLALNRDSESATFSGQLTRLNRLGTDTIQISVSGKTLDGCPIPIGMGSFTCTMVPPPRPLWFWIVIGAVGGAVLSFLSWLAFWAPRVRPSVGGKLIITDPQGNVLPAKDLYGLGARISLGSEGMIMLDATLDPEVSGVPAEIRAEVVHRRNVVRSVWYKEGKRSEDIYNGDEFWIGRYRIRYVNTAAEREASL